jgi:hypothetical protein
MESLTGRIRRPYWKDQHPVASCFHAILSARSEVQLPTDLSGNGDPAIFVDSIDHRHRIPRRVDIATRSKYLLNDN